MIPAAVWPPDAGQIVTFDQVRNHESRIRADIDKLTLDGPVLLRRVHHGRYSLPQLAWRGDGWRRLTIVRIVRDTVER